MREINVPKGMNQTFWDTSEVNKFLKSIADKSDIAQTEVDELYNSLHKSFRIVGPFK